MPGTIEDDWIETQERLEELMDESIHLRQQARNVFEVRYQETIDPDQNRWELCSRVLARKDVVERLSEAWQVLSQMPGSFTGLEAKAAGLDGSSRGRRFQQVQQNASLRVFRELT